MMIEYTFKDKVVQAHQIGRYVVHACCYQYHRVAHKDSSSSILCALTMSEATMLADALSIYGEDCPGTSFAWDGPGIMRVMDWARDQMRGQPDGPETKSFTAWHEERFGERPKPPAAFPIQSLSTDMF